MDYLVVCTEFVERGGSISRNGHFSVIPLDRLIARFEREHLASSTISVCNGSTQRNGVIDRVEHGTAARPDLTGKRPRNSSTTNHKRQHRSNGNG